MLILDKDIVENKLFFNYFNLDGYTPPYYLLKLVNRMTLTEPLFLIDSINVVENYLRSISFTLSEVDIEALRTGTHYDYELYYISDTTNIDDLPQLLLDNIDNLYDFGLLYVKGEENIIVDKVYI